MKKTRFLKIVSVLTLCFMLFSLAGCSLFYDGERTEDGRMFIGYSKLYKQAFVGMIWYSAEDTEFVLPDEYNGIPVTTLGGYIGRGYPCPFDFSMEFPEKFQQYREEQRAFGTTDPVFDETRDGWETFVFTIRLGRNIREIKYTEPCAYYGIEIDNGDGTYTSDILYMLVPYFIVPEENETFYAEDGKLYYKQSKELVDEFIYE